MKSRLKAASDAAKQTGSGKQPQLTELQKLCLSFVRSAKGNAAVDYVQPIEASGSDQAANLEEIEEPTVSQKRRPPAEDDKNEKVYLKKNKFESWKEKYFESMASNDERLIDAQIRKIELQSYNLLLQNIGLEKSLELQDHEILALRSTISPNLSSIPSHLTQFIVEEELVVNTVGAGSSVENNTE